MAEETADSVKVFIRMRPLNRRELEEKQVISWQFNKTSMIEETPNGQRLYQFDYVFSPDGTNKETYEIVGKPIVMKAMEGFNGTVFTYGQTGSGKTWTMRGSETDPGIMFLCIRDVFGWKESHPECETTLRVSYLEVYNEEINDLLQEGAINLRIMSEDPVKGAIIERLTEEEVQTPEQLHEVLRRGEHNRSYASTAMNAESSRSHTIYRLVIEVNTKDVDDLTGQTIIASQRMSYLNLVDLAGSERQKSTGASGKTLKEGANINKSLLSLGAVINKLVEASNKGAKGGKQVFIPYRDSKLTRILKQSLGGNTFTSILCTLTGAGMHREETISTLKFGQLCKSIKNSVKSNEIVDDRTLLKNMKNIVADLRQRLIDAGLPTDETSPGSGAPVKTAVGPDPAIVLQLQKEKAELEARNRSLEAIVMNGAASGLEGSLTLPEGEAGKGENGPGQSSGGGISMILSMQKLRDENNALNDQIHFLTQDVTRLQAYADEVTDLEDARNAFDDYQRESSQQLEDERLKIEKEKLNLQQDRTTMLLERGNMSEKESRLGNLLSTLDERESKLRQYLLALKDQQEQWQRSVADLQRREDLVEDWQRNHAAKEKKLQDLKDAFDRKMSALHQREDAISEADLKFKQVQREHQERENKLQTAITKLASSEAQVKVNEEKIAQQEAGFRKREMECDMKERELLSRRREMESWDSLLREKDRKVSLEQRTIDDKEDAIRLVEEKCKQRELEVEQKSSEVQAREVEVATQREFYNNTMHTIELREAKSLEQARKLRDWEEDLTQKDVELHSWEAELLELQEKVRDVEAREEELEERIEKQSEAEYQYYNVKVAQISSMHAKEIADLESVVTEQLRIVANFQYELEKSKADVARKTTELTAAGETIKGQEELIELLRNDLAQLNITIDTIKKKQITKKRKRRRVRRTSQDEEALEDMSSRSSCSSSVSSNYSSASEEEVESDTDLVGSTIEEKEEEGSKPKEEDHSNAESGSLVVIEPACLVDSYSPSGTKENPTENIQASSSDSNSNQNLEDRVVEEEPSVTDIDDAEENHPIHRRQDMHHKVKRKKHENVADQPNVLLQAVAIQRVLYRILSHHNAVPDWTPTYPGTCRVRSLKDIEADELDYIPGKGVNSYYNKHNPNISPRVQESNTEAAPSIETAAVEASKTNNKSGRGRRHYVDNDIPSLDLQTYYNSKAREGIEEVENARDGRDNQSPTKSAPRKVSPSRIPGGAAKHARVYPRANNNIPLRKVIRNGNGFGNQAPNPVRSPSNIVRSPTNPVRSPAYPNSNMASRGNGWSTKPPVPRNASKARPTNDNSSGTRPGANNSQLAISAAPPTEEVSIFSPAYVRQQQALVQQKTPDVSTARSGSDSLVSPKPKGLASGPVSGRRKARSGSIFSPDGGVLLATINTENIHDHTNDVSGSVDANSKMAVAELTIDLTSATMKKIKNSHADFLSPTNMQ